MFAPKRGDYSREGDYSRKYGSFVSVCAFTVSRIRDYAKKRGTLINLLHLDFLGVSHRIP